MNYRLLLFCLLSVFTTYSQNETESKLFDHEIDSKAFGSKRTISIYLPVLYQEDSLRKFVVAYLFDGQFKPYMSMVSSLMEYYSQTEESIPLIVVSIHTDDRQAEFIPKASEEDNNSKSDLLAKHLREEVMPYIDANFRTEKYRLGIGHSLGGTFLFSETLKSNPLFDGIIAASPNLVSDDEFLVKQGHKFILENPNAAPYIYTEIGNVGEMENEFRSSLEKFDSIVKKEAKPNFMWNFNVLDRENHMTTFIRTYNDALLDFSKLWNLPDQKLLQLSNENLLAQVQTMFAQQSSFTKTEFAYTSINLNLMAKRLANLGKYEIANDVLNLSLAQIELEDLPSAAKHEKIQKIEKSKKYNLFYAISTKAKKAFDEKNYAESSRLYTQSFESGAKNGTHMERLDAARSYAQAGQYEEAFVQLDLLANYFKWRGSEYFRNDPLLMPLQKDKRWVKIMAKLDQNRVDNQD